MVEIHLDMTVDSFVLNAVANAAKFGYDATGMGNSMPADIEEFLTKIKKLSMGV